MISIEEWCREAMAHAEMNQTELAAELERATGINTPKSKVSKMLNGNREITAADMLAIARVTGYPLPNAHLGEAQIRHAVTSGGIINDLGQGVLPDVVIPAIIKGRDLCASIVASEDIAPTWPRGTVLFYDDGRDDIDMEALGFPCVAKIEGGSAMVGIVRKGTEPGLYHIIALSRGYESQWDQKLSWSSKIAMTVPPDLALTSDGHSIQ